MCDVLWPCDTGAEAATSYQTTFNQLQQSMTSFIQTNSQSTASSTFNMLDAKIKIGGSVLKGAKVKIDQKISLDKQVDGKLGTTQLANLKSMMDTQLTNMITQASEATASTGGAPVTSQDNVNITTNIQKITSQATELNNYNTLVDETINKADGTIEIKGSVGGEVVVDQSIVAKIIAKNLLDSVASQMMDDTVTAGLFNTASQTAKGTSKNLFDSLFEGIANVLGAGATPIIVSLIVSMLCCLCCVALIVFGLGGGGKGGGNGGGSGAAPN